jgi:hypothetical protein
MMIVLTPQDGERFQTSGYVVLVGAFDPAPLAAEVDAVLAAGASSAPAHSDQAGTTFRFVPAMGEETPASLELLDALTPVAATLLDAPAIPVRAKAVEYHSNATWHRDSELPIASLGCAAYLQPVRAGDGALVVVPGSHRTGGDPTSGGPAAGVAVETDPGDVIAFHERLVHGSAGGGIRRQWRVDFLAEPADADQRAAARRYLALLFATGWDGGYDVDRFPSYGERWRRSDRPSVAVLDELGAFDLAARQEDWVRRTRRAAARR